MKQQVLVLFGGSSTEHEISQRSAYTIVRSLREAGFGVHLLGITKAGAFLPFRLEDEAILNLNWEEEAQKALLATGAPSLNFPTLTSGLSVRAFLEGLVQSPIDLVFPAVHGVNSEDGVLQGFLEFAGLPYVGSSVLSSALCMDKELTKRLLNLEGIQQVAHVVLSREAIENNLSEELDHIEEELGFPCFVKPANGGSSVGAAKAQTKAELRQALIEAQRYDYKILVEEYCEAEELEVSVLGNETPLAACVGQIVVHGEGNYYDFDTKYMDPEAATVLVPAPIEEELSEELRSQALKIYKALGCTGLARVDFFVRKEDGEIFFNEVNTLPGFTTSSIYPQAFAREGISNAELVLRLCHLAQAEHQRKQRQTERA